jgi:hypothetical protein
LNAPDQRLVTEARSNRLLRHGDGRLAHPWFVNMLQAMNISAHLLREASDDLVGKHWSPRRS